MRLLVLLQRWRWPLRGLHRHRRKHRALRGGRGLRRLRVPQEDPTAEKRPHRNTSKN